MSQSNAALSEPCLADKPGGDVGLNTPHDHPQRRRSAARLMARARRMLSAARHPAPYLMLTTVLVALLMSALAAANYQLAPHRFSTSAMADVARAFAAGNNYAVFDLNIETRTLRGEHIALLKRKPDVVVLGASHWQEAHADLLPEHDFYNAHVHRDYHEDLMAVVGMLLEHDRLPRTLIMSIRDMTFLPDDQRTDTLWLTGLPGSHALKAKLGLAEEPLVELRPLRRWLGLLSLSTMLDNGARRLLADRLPGPVDAASLPTLDVLQSDGSIRWSDAHRAQFTPERTQAEVASALAQRRNLTLDIDPGAVAAVDKLLEVLTGLGVRVVMVHPPFNPDFYDQITGTPYASGLHRVQAVTAQLAARHGAVAVGSFDPDVAGCTAETFIDAEHSGPDCLQKVIDQVPGL